MNASALNLGLSVAAIAGPSVRRCWRGNPFAQTPDAQAQHAELLAADAQRADEMRVQIRGQLERTSQALDANDASEVRALLDNTAEALRTPAGHFCAHPVVDALLAAKAQRCRELGIPLDIQAERPRAEPPT